jgi:hypothetical protein
MRPPVSRIVTRRLRFGDIPALLHLEHQQWTREQAASAEDFRERIASYPSTSNGAFNAETGELLASLFCRPTTDAEWRRPGDWKTSTTAPAPPSSRGTALFGISLTSIEPGAALQLIAFQYLSAIRDGQRHAYLGSPMPGLSRHLALHPSMSVEEYAHAKRSGVPLDPQLRYYHGKGFRDIIAVRENYFPHESSRDHGAILRAGVPCPWLMPLLKLCPERFLRALASVVPRRVVPRQPSRPVRNRQRPAGFPPGPHGTAARSRR